MNDQKRNSVSGRVATPKNAQSGPAEMDAALVKAIDKRIRITTSATTIEGVLFTACPITNLVAVNTSANVGPGVPGNYRIIPVAQISGFQIVTADANGAVSAPTPIGFGDVVPSIARVDIDALRAREEEAVRKLKEYDGTRGKGVTREAQEIFDWFKRTLPVRWNDQTIIVSDSVLVKPPYGISDCRAPKDKQFAEAQIKRVLEGFYSRKKGGNVSIADSGTSTPANRPAVVPALPRKGG